MKYAIEMKTNTRQRNGKNPFGAGRKSAEENFWSVFFSEELGKSTLT